MSNNKQPNSEKKQYAMRDSADKPCVVVLLQRALSDIETFKSNDTISRRIATFRQSYTAVKCDKECWPWFKRWFYLGR